VAKEIFAVLYSQIKSPVVMGALKEQFKSVGGAPAEAAIDLLEGAGKGTDSVTDKVKGLFKKKE
jgi:hypothetical protein